MKQFFYAFIFLTLLTSNLFASDKILLDRIVAVVNDDIILKSSLEQKTIEAKLSLQERNILIQNQAELKLKVLDEMIMETLQLQRIEQLGIRVSDDELLVQVNEIATKNNISVMQLVRQLNASQIDGFKKLRERLRQQLLFQKLQQVEILDKTQVTEDEINNFLQRQKLLVRNVEYNLGHIVLNLPESPTPKQREKVLQEAQTVLKKLQAGQDFNQLAANYSQGRKALLGGDLGWLKVEQIPTFFSEQLVNMQVGEHSNIIKSSIGFHIIKLINKQDLDANMATQYKLYRFSILSDQVNKDAPPQQLIDIAKNIISLQSFNELNYKFPDIPAHINANSNLGWLVATQMTDDFYKIVQGLQPQQASLPVASNSGWDIIYLDNIRQIDLNIGNKKQEAIRTIRMKKANETFEIWLRRLKEDALINILL